MSFQKFTMPRKDKRRYLEKLKLKRPDILREYVRYSRILQYLELVKERYNLFVNMYTLGTTYEGRLVRGIEIDFEKQHNLERQSESGPQKPSKTPRVKGEKRNLIFIEGGTHGREWLTISSALHIIHQLTERHTRNLAILKKFRFFIVPVSNPDGYEFTLNKNLRWRKNRRPTSPSGRHIGIDCNRNYDFHWDKASDKVSGCTYKGEKPFSESETRAISTTLQNLAPNLLLFISLHSYAQAIMYPWGYTREPAENINELQAVASAGSYAIRAFSGRTYRTGSIVKLSSHVIGGSIVDYAYGVIKVPYAYVMELPDSNLGFQPPPEYIRPIGLEIWVGIKEMICCAEEMYKNKTPCSFKIEKIKRLYGRCSDRPKSIYSIVNTKRSG